METPVKPNHTSMKRKRKNHDTTEETPELPAGLIRVGAKRRRGVTDDRDAQAKGVLNIDVTSGSNNKLEGVPAKSLSPFTSGPVTDDAGAIIARTVEGAWQGCKAWKSKGHVQQKADGTWEPTVKWFRLRDAEFARAKGRRRPFGLKKTDGCADMAFIDGRMYQYVESRPKYVNMYRKVVENLPIMDKLEAIVRSGKPVQLIDGDGPPKHRFPNGLELTPENWKRMINDPSCSFGHCWVVARILAERCYPRLFAAHEP
jgi:hypothetical protein